MAAINHAPSTRGLAWGLHHIAARLHRALAWLMASSEDMRTRRLLMSLSERELADIGLTRCDIDKVCTSYKNG